MKIISKKIDILSWYSSHIIFLSHPICSLVHNVVHPSLPHSTLVYLVCVIKTCDMFIWNFFHRCDLRLNFSDGFFSPAWSLSKSVKILLNANRSISSFRDILKTTSNCSQRARNCSQRRKTKRHIWNVLGAKCWAYFVDLKQRTSFKKTYVKSNSPKIHWL